MSSLEELSYSTLIYGRVHGHYQLCHNCFHLAVIFRIYGGQNFASALLADNNLSALDQGCKRCIAAGLFI